MSERKCDECDDIVKREYEGKFLCQTHLDEARITSNAKYEKTIFYKKCAIIITGLIVVIGGTLVILEFFPIFK